MDVPLLFQHKVKDKALKYEAQNMFLIVYEHGLVKY